MSLLFLFLQTFLERCCHLFSLQGTQVSEQVAVFLVWLVLAWQIYFPTGNFSRAKKVNIDDGSLFRYIVIVASLIFDVALNCTIGLTPYVDNFTHLGGLALGFLYGLTTGHHISSRFFGVRNTFLHLLLRFMGIFVSIIAITIAAYFLAKSDGETSPCTKCLYLSCVPFPFWEEPGDRWWHCD